MTISYSQTLTHALIKINSQNHHEFIIHPHETPRTIYASDEILELYGQAKWAIVDLINAQYHTKHDLYNWINHNNTDEVAYFLNEVGSNTLSHSEYKIPSKFHLWLGKKSFIIGIEQKGQGFNAQKIDEKRLKENEGAAFDFFRNSQAEIFFDNPLDARVVYFLAQPRFK